MTAWAGVEVAVDPNPSWVISAFFDDDGQVLLLKGKQAKLLLPNKLPICAIEKIAALGAGDRKEQLKTLHLYFQTDYQE